VIVRRSPCSPKNCFDSFYLKYYKFVLKLLAIIDRVMMVKPLRRIAEEFESLTPIWNMVVKHFYFFLPSIFYGFLYFFRFILMLLYNNIGLFRHFWQVVFHYEYSIITVILTNTSCDYFISQWYSQTLVLVIISYQWYTLTCPGDNFIHITVILANTRPSDYFLSQWYSQTLVFVYSVITVILTNTSPCDYFI